jgi:hypothetical protein
VKPEVCVYHLDYGQKKEEGEENGRKDIGVPVFCTLYKHRDDFKGTA